jgi:hypothetical protein
MRRSPPDYTDAATCEEIATGRKTFRPFIANAESRDQRALIGTGLSCRFTPRS